MIEVIKLISSDWKRYTEIHKNMNVFLFIAIYINNPGMFFSLIYRIEHYLIINKVMPLRLLGFLFSPIYLLLTYYILDFNIPPTVSIGKSLYIHNRGVIIAYSAKLGDHVTLIGPLTVGLKNVDGASRLPPSIGDNVSIFSGARIIGHIKIANNILIGANAVVVKDVPSNVVVGGVPAKIIKKLRKNYSYV